MSDLSSTFVAAVLLIMGAVLVHSVLTRRSAPVAEGTLVDFVQQPDQEVSGGSREFTPLLNSDIWQSEVVPDLETAEELLDRAEADGYQERELLVLGPSAFLVRWRNPG